MKPSVSFSDLGADVYADCVPAGLAAELPGLYSSLFSTVEYFETHDGSTGQAACTLSRPRHVLLFDRAGDTIEVLNKIFRMPANDAHRACVALFRTFPDVRRIHLEIMFPPEELGLPHLALHSTDHMIVDLPATVDAYTESLGRSTRRNLRLYGNRIERDFGSATTEIVPAGGHSAELLERFRTWKADRFRARGLTPYWESNPALGTSFARLVERSGEAHVTTLDDHEAAISFAFPVGIEVCARETAFDPAFEKYRLGLLAQYWLACAAVRRGARRFNLLWGTTEYKQRLGAVPQRATRVSVFRDRRSRMYSLDEEVEVARRRARSRGERTYWSARHAAGRLVRAATRRGRPGDDT